jgi:hypothetical protein
VQSGLVRCELGRDVRIRLPVYVLLLSTCAIFLRNMLTRQGRRTVCPAGTYQTASGATSCTSTARLSVAPEYASHSHGDCAAHFDRLYGWHVQQLDRRAPRFHLRRCV